MQNFARIVMCQAFAKKLMKIAPSIPVPKLGLFEK